ncbi:MAG TPA: tetratricopeptide repeat protein [Terracidiphilus sp.]|nr:tetratricopeptide repeat protein [Terracidiphilus sp.]
MKTRVGIAALAVLGACALLLRVPHGVAVQAAEQAPAQAGAAATPTWSHDIAPIVYNRCTACHHPGGAGPFSLLSYAEARRWAPQILQVTQSRFMPPWLPEPGYGDFADSRRLSDRERDLIRDWIKAHTPEGDPAEAPAPPQYDGGWVLGKPDLILKVQRPYTLAATGTDVFWNFILPYPLKETHYIRALQIRPRTPQIVHHANITIDRLGTLRRENPKTWQDGFGGMELYIDAGNRFDPDSHFLFWKPDSPALVELKGMPWRLDAGNDLILNMHLKPSGKPEIMDAELGLYFTDDPPTAQPMLISLERDDKLDIPPGDANFVVEDSLTLPEDVEVLGVYPHAHYLGHDLEGWAILPSGKKEWLIWIRNWDIDRQSIYHYREPILLPAGTVLHMRYSYDNSANNVHNPHIPPVRVRAGNRSEDEMAHLWFQLLPVHVKPGDPDPRLKLEEAWMRNRLSKIPGDSVSLYNLASALSAEGKFQEAAGYYAQLLRRTPTDERTLTAMGVALNGEGNWRAAEEQFRAAAAGDPAACDARFNLASLELHHQQAAGAEGDFRALLASCPPDAEVHGGLGAALASEGRGDDAAAEFLAALKLNPDNVTALVGLGSLELDANQTDAALEHLKHAVQADASSADAHEQLARAYAMTGAQAETLEELRTAARLRPDDAQIHSALSQVLASAGSLTEAIAEERTALKLEDDDADGWNNLGVMLLREGQVSEARTALEHALKLQPDHAQARANLQRLNENRNN